MFGTYFKASLKALPWLLILPILVWAVYEFFVWPYIEENGIFNEEFVVTGAKLIIASVVIGFIVNFVLVMIIPAAVGGTNSGAKKAQFYVGFFANLLLTLLLPFIYINVFWVDGITAGVLIALHAFTFLVPFILSALFVAPAYARAFWFVNRR
ncbi:MAG: hypothetical protein Ta2A_18240 [Treponemataceae bacterium]|nr:MAG: hypothetical protein Ta2A_18240 [Treponemataceae bacterium]